MMLDASNKRRKQLKPSKYGERSEEEEQDTSSPQPPPQNPLMLLNDLFTARTAAAQIQPNNNNNTREPNPMEFLAQHFLANLNQMLLNNSQRSLAETGKSESGEGSVLNQSGCSADLSLPTTNSSVSEASLNNIGEGSKPVDHEPQGIMMTEMGEKRNLSIDEGSVDQGSESDRKKMREEIKIQPYMSSNGLELFSCPLCNESNIADRAKLTQHLQLHQSDQRREDGKHICCFCFNELSSNSSLERHLLTHTNHRPFQCVHCDKAFTTNGNLSRHIKTSHQSLKQSKCPQMPTSNPVSPTPVSMVPPPSTQTPNNNLLPLRIAPPPMEPKANLLPVFQPLPINNFLLNALNMIQMHQGRKNVVEEPIQHPASQPQVQFNPFNGPLFFPMMHTSQMEVPKKEETTEEPEPMEKDDVESGSRKMCTKKSYFYRYFYCKVCKMTCVKRNRKINLFLHRCYKSPQGTSGCSEYSLGSDETENILDLSNKSIPLSNEGLGSALLPPPKFPQLPSEMEKENSFLSGGEEKTIIRGASGGLVFRKKNSYKDAPRLISCPVTGCKQKFPWNSSLKRHILTHTPHKPFACTRCNKSFSTKSNRERHMERVHKVSLKRQKKKKATEDSLMFGGMSQTTLTASELTGEELICMDTNDKQAEDISNKLLQTAGNPKVEPNPVRFMNGHRPLANETDLVAKQNNPISLPENIDGEDLQQGVQCSFCQEKLPGKGSLLAHIMSNHLVK